MKTVKHKNFLVVKGIGEDVVRAAEKKFAEAKAHPELIVRLTNAPARYARIRNIRKHYRLLTCDGGETWTLYNHDDYEKVLKREGVYQ